jgi:hypothetical protein
MTHGTLRFRLLALSQVLPTHQLDAPKSQKAAK